MAKTKIKPKLKRKNRRHGRRIRACPPLALIAGGLLLIMATPRFMSALVQLPGNYVPQRLERQIEVSDAALAKLSSTRRGSLKWNSGGQQWVELGLAQLRQAERNESDREILLPGAVADLRMGLGMKPANSPGWLWLAEAELLRGGITPAVWRAIEMSIRTAPLDRRYYMKRLQISLLIWPQLDLDARQAVANQVHYAQRIFPRQLAGLAGEPEYGNLVQTILKMPPKG